MPLPFLLDEHLRGPLWRAIQRHNVDAAETLDVVRVGDHDDLPLGSKDDVILLWAERTGRLLVSRDVSTLSGHLADHISAGHRCPGIFMLRRHATLPLVIEFLVETAHR